MENQLFYPHIHWTSFKKFLLRFGVIFFFLPMLQILSYFDDHLYPWIANVVFSIPEISLEPTSSGDRCFNYIELFVYFVLAIVGSVIWSFFNKKDKTYDTLLHYFLIFIRYYLASEMIGYGYAKVFNIQFSAPGLSKLLQSYGDSSPMGIAWTFIGASKPYTVFSGLAEILGGVLLLFRRTTLAGAMISFAVMFNVVMLNFCYDVPVKLHSTQLALLAFIIIICNGHVLWSAVWSNKAVATVNYKPLFQKKWLKITAMIINGLAIFYFIAYNGYKYHQLAYELGISAPKTPLYGIYKPTQYIVNNDTMGLHSHDDQWKYLILEYPGFATVKTLKDSEFYFELSVDTIKKTMIVNLQNDTSHKFQLSYNEINDSTLNLKGKLSTSIIDFTFRKINLNSFTLTNRGFHWINETPFNK
ncbi:MAG: hypothetical protein V4580_11670 [Bacteroidota bacterium]